MRAFVFKLLKFLLILLLLGLLAGGCYLLVLWRGWPLWLGGAVFAGILSLAAAGIFARKLFFRRREKQFVRRVIDTDDAHIQAAPDNAREGLKEMQQRWAEAVTTLQESNLHLHGNPLYVLPWYMVLGESGSGKSTAIKRSGLTSILTDVSPETENASAANGSLRSTRNVDWCFFKEAVILDTAGRYAVPVNEGPDKQEWEEFLALLTRYRRKEPLDGLVITVSTERLLNDTQEQLTEYGLSLRKRIDEMMRSMGARFPVYVLVTKLDRLLGVNALMETMSAEEARQCMGYAPSEGSVDPAQSASTALEHVAQRLRTLRLPLLSRSASPSTAALTFPAELTALTPSLTAFMQGCFASSPYAETPFLRGIYFSSGKQEGQVRTKLMQTTELFSDTETLAVPASENGLFLTDLFASILPGDRGIYTPLREFLKWRTTTRNLALVTWLLLTFCVAGLFTYSFVNTKQSIEIVAEPFPKTPKLTGHLDHDLYMLSLYGQAVKLMQQESAQSWIGHLGLDYAQQATTKMQQTYVSLTRNRLLQPLDKQMNKTFNKMDAKELNNHISSYISYISWRINMLKHRLAGESLDAVPDPPDQALAMILGGRLPEIAPLLQKVYQAYLTWNRHNNVLKAESHELRMWLHSIMGREGVELHWLVQWANAQRDVQPVTLGEFWLGPQAHNSQEVTVPGAYTPDGYQAIDGFLSQINKAVDDRDSFSKREAQFRTWYAEQYRQAWTHFARNFSQGTQRLISPENWQNQASSMATLQNPYFKLLHRIHTAFKPIAQKHPKPALGRLAEEFVQLQTNLKSKSQDATLAEKIEKSAAQRLERTVGQFKPETMQELQARTKATQAVQSYLKELQKFLPASVSLESAYSFARRLYGPASSSGNQSGNSTPLQAAEGHVHTLNANMLGLKNATSEQTHVFWQLVRGPLVYMVTYISNQASCHLQMLWESHVLSRTGDIPTGKLRSKLFGNNGLVHKFTNGPAQPFLQRSQNGWSAVRLIGVPFPLQTPFLKFLGQASQNTDAVQDAYTIHISALPTDVNSAAKIDPTSTKLTLDCEGGVQTLDNFNYQVAKDFVWKPNKCKKVSLEITFPNITLSKTWKGHDGMQQFLRAFDNNTKTFSRKDFPQHTDMLASQDIKTITVAYKMDGAEAVRTLLDQQPPSPPQSISWCWHRNYGTNKGQ